MFQEKIEFIKKNAFEIGLTPREEQVLTLRNESVSLEKAAKIFNCTRERVRQIERKAMGKVESFIARSFQN